MASSPEAHGYFKQQLLSDSYVDAKVYKGLSLYQKLTVHIEERSFPNLRSADMYCSGLLSLQALDHPQAARIVNAFVGTTGSAAVCWVIVEVTGDVLRADSRKWTEGELRDFLEVSLDLLSDVQARKIYFRNITVQSFRVAAEAVKLSDFSQFYSLERGNFYLSPAVRRYLDDDEEDDFGAPLPFHNPYKSEAYSLGVVLLSLIHSREIADLITEATDIQSQIQSLISQSPVSDFMKSLLSHMLDWNEETRLDPTEALLVLQGSVDISSLPRMSRRAERHKEAVTRIETRMEAPRVSVLARSVYLTCVCCFQTLRVGANTRIEDLQPLIPLACDGKNHIFCGNECMLKFAFIETRGEIEDIGTLKCPICLDYHFSSKVLSAIREKWAEVRANISRVGTMATNSLEESANLLRKSSPVIMPINESTGDIVTFHCVLCREAADKAPIFLHFSEEGEEQHAVCSMNCLEIYTRSLAAVASLEEIPCPVVSCVRRLSISQISSTSSVDQTAISALFPIRECASEPFHAQCIHCRSEIRLDSRYRPLSLTRPVFLYCQPPSHVFCSKICLQSYVEACTDMYRYNLHSVVCPECRMRIEAELIFDCYDGEENFRSIVRDIRGKFTREGADEACMECKKNRGLKADCGHWYCEECMRGWCLHLLSRAWSKEMPCPKCGRKINVEQLRKHPNSLMNILSVAKHKLLG